MKEILDWQNQAVANIFDEVTLWSAPFGRLLLEHIPMQGIEKVLDIGFGTGFPLLELSQRFGEKTTIYGIDIWAEGIQRTREKIQVLELNNVTILEESAATINLAKHSIDLVTSNLGINNFVEKEKVYSEVHRVLTPQGSLAITTNPIGTFAELFQLFADIFKTMNWEEEQEKLAASIAHRATKELIVAEFEKAGFTLKKSYTDSTSLRFTDALAVLDHSLIRIGFRISWELMIREEQKANFFNQLLTKIQQVIDTKGEFQMTIPMLYLEFEKTALS